MSFFNKNKERMMVTVVAIILIVLIGVTSSERMALSGVEKIIGNILAPVGRVTNSIGKNISNFFNNIKEISFLKEENERLEIRIAELEEENRDYLNIIGKFDFLKNEQALMKDTKHDLIPAQIVGKEPGNWFNRFTIDKGSNDGIRKGATVVQGVEIEQNVVIEGMVGRVIDVGPDWAKVVTVIDELSKISFKAIRTQDGGVISGSSDRIISGNGDSRITGYLFDNKADIIKGDKLYTSELGGSYVSNIYIGEVEDIIDGEDLMKRINVKPVIDFKKLYKVFIISE